MVGDPMIEVKSITSHLPVHHLVVVFNIRTTIVLTFRTKWIMLCKPILISGMAISYMAS